MSKLISPRLLRHRVYLLLAAHLLLLGTVYLAAFQLRFDLSVPEDARQILWKSLPWALAVKLSLFYFCGSLHGWWRHVTFADLAGLLRVSTLSTLAIAFIDYFFIADYQIPRAVLVLDWGLTIFLVGGLRSIWRLVREHGWHSFTAQGRPALLVGADPTMEVLARQIHRHRGLNYRIVGFLHEDFTHHGSWLGGIPILGGPENAVQFALERQVHDILVLADTMPGDQLRRLMARCRSADIAVRMIPPLDDILSGAYRVPIREVDINDLLRRDPVELDQEGISQLLQGRRVLVTGAGGSIGSEICRQIVKCRPERLILVERAENSLFHIERELRNNPESPNLVPTIADVGDQRRMRSLFDRHRPHVVFHAAAHKHVPMMEDNPGEALKNNVLATVNLVDLADQFHVKQFVLISTDKAVRPTSIMGLSKQLAERYLHAFSETSATRFLAVRFGNVLASSGSVVPIFQDQIRRGGPITITHPDMERFFMTIPEASQLVLQAAVMGRGGEIFVLDMGRPVKIVDLAHDLIRLSGLRPDEFEFEITGPRPGEKLREELYSDDEQTMPTPHPKLRVSYHRPCSLSEIRELIDALAAVVDAPEGVIREKLNELAPDYVPEQSVSSLAGDTAADMLPRGIASPVPLQGMLGVHPA